jgi:hypothetical protein
METMKATVGLASILLSIALSLEAAEDALPKPEWTVGVSGSFNYGPAAGFLQTPAGGQPGSSSHRRPTLDELGVDEAVFYDVQASMRWRRLNLNAGYQAIALDGRATLSESLISHDITFPAGTSVRSETDLNWIRAGAGWKFEFLQQNLELIPRAELAVLDFSYKLAGGGQAADRSYVKGAFRLGLEARYPFNRVVGVSLNAAGSVPISNTPQIAAVTAALEFNLLPSNRRLRPHLFLGGGAQRIDYEDNQKLPNHFRVDVAPFIAAGLGMTF